MTNVTIADRSTALLFSWGLATGGAAAGMTLSTPGFADDAMTSPRTVEITATRLGDGIAGTSTSVISNADIDRDPADTIPDIVARQAGVQLQSLYGEVNGAGSGVSLRGFGATGTANTLILVDGRRVNDPDQSVVDLSAIPLASIERIEIVRGNSAAVLYGDGAVGGVINIVTKNAFDAPPSAALDVGVGSDRHRDVAASVNRGFGDSSLALFAAAIDSNGYRDNNALRERNVVGEFRQAIDQGTLYLTLRGDDQHLGLPGTLTISPTLNQVAVDPRATNSPHDYGDQQAVNLSLGGTRSLGDGIDLIVDGGIRHKEQQSSYLSYFTYDTVKLTTFSLTPRLDATNTLVSLPAKAIVGIDLYDSFYGSNYAVAKGDPANDRHSLQQRTLAAYAQETIKLWADTDLALGARLQRADIAARERINLDAPGGASLGTPGTPLNTVDNEVAAHAGLDHRLTEQLTLYARLGHSMRMPNIDDRNYVAVYPTNFELKTQTSFDQEIGVRTASERFQGQVSAYSMQLRNEIDYDPGANGGFGANVNLDPTRRNGIEAAAAVALTATLRLKAALTYIDATYRDGPYRGNVVPQVAARSGNVGLSWDIWPAWVLLDVDARHVGNRRLGDDQANSQPLEPAYTVVDLKISGNAQGFRWSVAVQNLADSHYFDQGYVGYSPGSYTVYPMPGRSVMGRAGVSF